MEQDLADQGLVLYLWQDQWLVQIEDGAVVRHEGMERVLGDREPEQRSEGMERDLGDREPEQRLVEAERDLGVREPELRLREAERDRVVRERNLRVEEEQAVADLERAEQDQARLEVVLVALCFEPKRWLLVLPAKV